MNSVLNDVFSDLEQNYEPVELTKYVNFIGGSQPPKSEFSDKEREGYVRLIQIRDYKSDNNIVYVKKTSVRRFCNKDDVMIGRYGPPVFQILRGLDGAYNVALMKAEPNEEFICKDFLFLFLKNPSIQNYIIGLSQRSAGQSGVNKEALEKYLIALPAMNKQKEIVLYLNQVSAQIEQVKLAQQQKMQSLLGLKSSILDQAFHGKL
jgi:type I restriction enzyme S subunit